ncbi:MAG: oligosaccharide flippase family protein, partial [bacterium]
SFLRNMILARLLTKADFGAAATLGIVLGLLELTAKTGIARFVVQDRDGDRPEFIATVHAFQTCLGLLSALLVLAATPFSARIFDLHGPLWVLCLLALIPLLRGLEHADVRTFERNLRFGPSTMVEMVPQVIITAAAWPVAIWLPDFRCVLVLMIAKSAMSCAMSHVLANRPYRWQWQKVYLRRMVRFGWPLLINGFLMFGIFQGDQLIVATFYTLSDLGPYAAASALAMVPGLLFGNVIGSVTLPILSQVQDDKEEFQKRYRQVMAAVILLSATSGVGMILGSEPLMRIVYGEKYAGSGIILGWLAACHALRNLRIFPTTAALAQGDSQNSLFSNIGRVIGLIPALVAALTGMPIWTVAASGLVGEAIASWVSFKRLERRDGIPFYTSLHEIAIFALGLGGAGLAWWAVVQRMTMPVTVLVTLAGTLLAGVIIVVATQELRAEVSSARQAFMRGGWREVWLQLRVGVVESKLNTSQRA